MTLDQVIADAREDAATFRRYGDEARAQAIESLCDNVAQAAEPFTVWLSEAKATLRSGHSAPWLRARFPRWASEGLARWNPASSGERQYLQCVIPLQRTQNTSVVQDAIEEARRAS
jgi:hypothetical protein